MRSWALFKYDFVFQILSFSRTQLCNFAIAFEIVLSRTLVGGHRKTDAFLDCATNI